MYLCIDTETGSIKPLGNVLEIYAAVTDENFNIIDTFHSYCKPTRPNLVQKKALEINGIDINKLTEEPGLVQSKFLLFCQKHQMLRFVAYNSTFDWNQINAWLKAFGNHWQFERYVSKINHLDGLKVARQQKFKSYKLENVARELNCHKPGAHSASVDVEMMIDVLKQIYKRPETKETVEMNRKYIDAYYIIFTPDGEFLMKQAAFEDRKAFEYIMKWIYVRGLL